jgi:cellulose synthase/poly-beta-1,6-N-acetylglucosamine synthase-like glycosyltransferase
MMLYPAMIALGLAVVFLGMQVVWAWRLAVCYPPKQALANPGAQLPRVAVVLSVRGADPSLVECLRCLLRQDYPHYEVHIIVDSDSDPAWDLLRPLLDDEAPVDVQVRVLETKHETCSLKVSALAQAIQQLGPSVEVVALIDADVIPYAGWLRDLVGPFSDKKIGATTGVRWYMPDTGGWGSQVRCVWNAAASTQMFAFRIPWGGSMAFRARLFWDTELLTLWKRSFCEDTVSYGILRRLGLGVAFVPAATMVNPESISLRNCFSFIRRQMLTVRLHHPHWQWVRLVGLGSVLTLLMLLAVCGASVAGRDFLSAGLMAIALGMYCVGLASAMAWIDVALRSVARNRGDAIPAFSWKLALAGPLAQGIYLAALVSVSFLRKVDWRGITYELYGRTPVRLTRYQPFHAEPMLTDRAESVV